MCFIFSDSLLNESLSTNQQTDVIQYVNFVKCRYLSCFFMFILFRESYVLSEETFEASQKAVQESPENAVALHQRIRDLEAQNVDLLVEMESQQVRQ